ncbi:tRNA lysidine(34) synthetase TilS [Staphylococcus devriesei]|uniref:tRNA lysidine(34) synthetase TilS n=1 Tax=Staphylococcus devriesei TaxID=586733 RepID=UPI000E6854BB|nr:tRNA lysidine(34) synthetase TilS [Staphylococcus devriesei]RIL73111.1 tRNA lysidine(34) synthetase TilS [Staphylococcus devriesei]
MKVNTSLWKETDHIVLAVSTGVDSMCLLHRLLFELPHTYRKLTCLHVNHGLRQASQEEEQFIKDYCAQYSISCYIKHLDLSDLVAQGKSIQADARYKRYEWFDIMMHDLEADVLVTAHHLNDQLETIFYRVFTGRSTRNSLGIADIAWRHNYKICRPLLDTFKDNIRAYQQSHHVPYYEDHSNHDNKYTRNDIRNRILPMIDNNVDLDSTQLLKLKSWHDNQLRLTHQRVECFINANIHKDSLGYFQCNRDEFNALDEISKMVLLDKLIEDIQLDKTFSEKNYQQWFEQISSQLAQFEITLSEKWIIQIAYDKFILMAKNKKPVLDEQIITHADTYRFGSYRITISSDLAMQYFPLTIRTRRDGDKFKLNGRNGHKKVSRLMIDYKIDNDARAQMPLVEDQQHNIIAIGDLYIAEAYDKYIKINKLEMNDK